MAKINSAYHTMPRQTYIAQEGFPFIGICAIASLFFLLVGWEGVFVPMFGLLCFVGYFFRNPHRDVPEGAGLIISPADGRVLSVERVESAPELAIPAMKVSIFMSVFNVHINRMPLKAKIKKVVYYPGEFLVASLNKASEKNERNVICLEDEVGRQFVVVQIAGLIARRIVCYLRDGDVRARGKRIGLIRFGSRVDLYLPLETVIDVKVGDKTVSGESIIGRLAN